MTRSPGKRPRLRDLPKKKTPAKAAAKQRARARTALAHEYAAAKLQRDPRAQLESRAADGWHLLAVDRTAGAAYYRRRRTSRVPDDVTLFERLLAWFDRAGAATPEAADYLNEAGWPDADRLARALRARLARAGVGGRT